MRVLVMGATGRTGGAVMRHATARGMTVRAATRSGEWDGDGEVARFDLLDPSTFQAAMKDCDALFVMRPPPVTSAAPWPPLFDAAREAGVRRMVVSSVMGADRNRFLPHRHMEEAAREAGIRTAILRPSDYMQNLETVLADSVRSGLIRLPAGKGRSALIDVDDIGECAAVLLANSDEGDHALTGPEALSWGDVCVTLSGVLDHEVSYRHVDPLSFFLRERTKRPASMAGVMTALYTVQRLGLADKVTDKVKRLLGRHATVLRTYAERERAVWEDKPSSHTSHEE